MHLIGGISLLSIFCASRDRHLFRLTGWISKTLVEFLQVLHSDVDLRRLEEDLVLGPQLVGGHQPGQAGVGALLDLKGGCGHDPRTEIVA